MGIIVNEKQTFQSKRSILIVIIFFLISPISLPIFIGFRITS